MKPFLFARLPFQWKFILLAVLLFAAFVLGMSWFLEQIAALLERDYNVLIEPLLVFKRDLIRFFHNSS